MGGAKGQVWEHEDDQQPLKDRDGTGDDRRSLKDRDGTGDDLRSPPMDTEAGRGGLVLDPSLLRPSLC